MLLRIFAAIVALFLSRRAVTRASEPLEGMLHLLVIGTSYLMLFNPKTETNSYVILAPVIALFCVRIAFSPAWRCDAWFLVGLELLLGSENFPKPIFHATDFWLKPLVALVFLGWFFWRGQHWKPDQKGAAAVRLGPGSEIIRHLSTAGSAICPCNITRQF